MNKPDFYKDKKFCAECEGYVNYLMGLEFSYCVTCGGRVRLFSKQDWENFNDTISRGRPKGGRPRKKQNKKESA